MHPIGGLQYLLEYNMLVLFVKTQFLIWIRDSQPARIWTPISQTKSGYANHWATLRWLLVILKYFASFKFSLCVSKMHSFKYESRQTISLGDAGLQIKLSTIGISSLPNSIIDYDSIPIYFWLKSIVFNFLLIKRSIYID